MAADERVTQLEEFLAERGRPLLRVAALLGGGPEAGEDLLVRSGRHLVGLTRVDGR